MAQPAAPGDAAAAAAAPAPEPPGERTPLVGGTERPASLLQRFEERFVTSPFLKKLETTFLEAYSTSPHCTLEDGVVVDYEPYKLASLRNLSAVKGTVLLDPLLLVEMVILTLLFLLAAVPLLLYQLLGQNDSAHYVHEKLQAQESNIRKFSMIMTMLAAFLLSLYMGIMVGRWWTIRTAGVGAIKAAAADLQMFVSQFVTRDEEVLSAIRRYARASLRLIFLWRRQLLENEKEMEVNLVDTGILTKDELALLTSSKWNHNLYESIWAWEVSIIETLHQEGLIKGEQMLMMLLQKCCDGRAGVQTIVTHLAVKVPMQYVHLLGFIVKLHNLIVAGLMGICFSVALKERNVIICLQLYGRTLLMPFLFNAILTICAELSDPFDGGAGDFPQKRYDAGIEKDARSLTIAGQHLPAWLEERKG
eukprot:TRINITY_DN71746_c0_g1_i1.p1 TRINITY_DN71746_c0_g1~~TRINITY_DN71746_c0_g1_i1.p1  ORF type:complete len:448 (-),score=90.74 TRINITY_DN71746_c0_g1_i1:27-1286(-)